MFIKFLLSILSDQRGEFEPEEGGGEGQGDDLTPANEGTKEQPPEQKVNEEGDDEGQQGQEDQGGNDSSPRYGEFGNEPDVDTLYSKYKEERESHENLRNKTSQTERNLASARKAAQAAGFEIYTDPDGNSQLVPIQRRSEEKSRKFTDENKQKLQQFFEGEGASDNFLNLLSTYFDDVLDDRFSSYENNLRQRHQFVSQQTEANNRMLEIYPQLDIKKKDALDRKFYDLATEIWESNYKHLPQGELYAAHEAATRLKISPISIANAQKQGYEKGKENRKVLAPVSGNSDNRGGGSFRKLSKDEYLKLSQSDRDKYDQREVAERKK